MDGINSRDHVLRALERELLGPSPAASGVASPLDTVSPVRFASRDEARGPFVDAATGEEVIHNFESPFKRYGVGVLYPPETEASTSAEENAGDASNVRRARPPVADKDRPDGQEARAAELDGSDADGTEGDLDLSSANTLNPSSMGVSFLLETKAGTTLTVTFTAGRYRSFPAYVPPASKGPVRTTGRSPELQKPLRGRSASRHGGSALRQA